MTTSRLIGLCMGLGAAVALADPIPVATLDETDMFFRSCPPTTRPRTW